MFNILNTILVAAIVTAEVYGLFLGVYLMLFEGVTTREGVVTALEGRHQLVIVCGQIGFISLNLLMLAIGLLGPVVRKLLDRSKNKKSKYHHPAEHPPAMRRPGVFLFL